MGNLGNGNGEVLTPGQEARIREIIQEVVGANMRPVTINIGKLVEVRNIEISDLETSELESLVVDKLFKVIQTAASLSSPESTPPVREE